MRREFTGVSGFSMLVATVAGIVLCMQLAHFKTSLGVELSAPVLWAVEVGIFGTAVYLWQTEISLGGWTLGIAGLVLVRVVLTALAGMAFSATYGEGERGAGMQEMSALTPRMCSIFFSLMVCYPLRLLLPCRPRRARAQGRRFAESPAAQAAVPVSGDSVWSLVILPRHERGDTSAGDAAGGAWRAAESLPSAREVEGTIELPVRAVLAQMPQELVRDGVREIKDLHMISIPLEVVLPQLREARVVATVAQIRRWLAAGARKLLVEPPDLDEERESVKLPLELIVPQLPREALALPAPSPPAWARVDEIEHIVFATV